jgi:hypothetical protein
MLIAPRASAAQCRPRWAAAMLRLIIAVFLVSSSQAGLVPTGMHEFKIFVIFKVTFTAKHSCLRRGGAVSISAASLIFGPIFRCGISLAKQISS